MCLGFPGGEEIKVKKGRQNLAGRLLNSPLTLGATCLSVRTSVTQFTGHMLSATLTPLTFLLSLLPNKIQQQEARLPKS